MNFLLVTTITALVAVAAGVLVAMNRASGGTDPVAAALTAIPGSKAGQLLEQERQQMIQVDAASKTLSLVGSPKLATRPSSSSGTASTASGSSSSSPAGAAPPPPSAPPPDPGTAQSIAFNMMPSFGFPTNTQYGCLVDLWNQESGWRWNAENASGAYGIPQALPGSKMASAGADWQTNPATQIRWGLGYIKGQYGNPCGAWAHEQSFGWY
jgi:hypothetical protein